MSIQRIEERALTNPLFTPELDLPAGVSMRFGWVRAGSILVDLAYQRHLTKAVVDQLVRTFNPLAFGVIAVSERRDGSYACIDGQHRIEAVLERGGPDGDKIQVPAWIYRGLTVDQEAALFAMFNSLRNRPSPLEVFHAQLLAGDHDAVTIERVVRESGWEIAMPSHASQQGTIGAVGSLHRLHRSLGERGLREVLRLINDSLWHRTEDAARYWSLRTLGYFYQAYHDLPQYDRDRLLGLLNELSPSLLRNTAAILARQSAISVQAAMVVELVTRYNHRLPVSQQLPPYRTASTHNAEPKLPRARRPSDERKMLTPRVTRLTPPPARMLELQEVH